MAEYIEKGAIYNKIAELEELARNRYLDTPSNSPVFARYMAQMQERTALKFLIADFPAADVVPVAHGKPVTKIRTVTLTDYHEEPGHFAEDGANLYRKKMTHADIPYDHCPVCGATLCSRWHNYCGKCGAKMDGGADNE